MSAPGIDRSALRTGASADQLVRNDNMKPNLREVALGKTLTFEGIISGSVPDFFDLTAKRSDAAKRERLDALSRSGLAKLDGIRIPGLSGAALRMVEADAVEQARANLKRSGALLKTRVRDDSGRVFTAFSGDASVTWAPWNAQTQRVQFNNHAGQHREPGRWVADGMTVAEVPAK